jgi:hypothetical protein
MRQLTLSMGQQGQRFAASFKEPPFQVKGLSFIFNIYKWHTCNNILYMLLYCGFLKNTFSPLQVKNKPRDEESEHAFILGSMDCTV